MESEICENRGEVACIARTWHGSVVTVDLRLDKEKAVETFRSILDRALATKCRSVTVQFDASVDSVPMFDYEYEEYVL